MTLEATRRRVGARVATRAEWRVLRHHERLCRRYRGIFPPASPWLTIALASERAAADFHLGMLSVGRTLAQVKIVIPPRWS